MANLKDILEQPEKGWRRIDDTSELITYTGNDWAVLTAFNTFYNSSLHQCQTPDKNARIKFKFKGTKIRLLNGLSVSRENLAIKIDGVEETFSCNTQGNSSFFPHLVYEKTGLSNTEHTAEIRLVSGEYMSLDAIDVEEIKETEVNNFPVKVGSEANVTAYANTLIKGEEQLLVTREGNLYITDGNGGYKSISDKVDLTNYYNKTETEELVNSNLHTHENMKTVNSLGDSAGMLTYNGRVVVNNSEYSFKTLPRRKAPTNSAYNNSTQGGRLPWQV